MYFEETIINIAQFIQKKMEGIASFFNMKD